MSQNRSLVVLVAAAVLISAVGYLVFRPARAEGVVDHKAITGARGSMSSTIVTFTDAGVAVKDEEFNGDFEVSTTVTEALAHRLGSWYDEVNYLVSMRSGGETMAYFVSREDFNKVDVGGRIRFIPLSFKATSIRILKILE